MLALIVSRDVVVAKGSKPKNTEQGAHGAKSSQWLLWCPKLEPLDFVMTRGFSTLFNLCLFLLITPTVMSIIRLIQMQRDPI